MTKAFENISNEFLRNLTKSFVPQIPLEQLIIELNNIYHHYEAKSYDGRHPEIFEQICEIWQEMLEEIQPAPESRTLKVLDYGCGTGFELGQFIKNFKYEDVESIHCFDPSNEMLQECERSHKDYNWKNKITFTNDPAQVFQGGPYDLILTNSVMHHIYDYDLVVESFYESLLPGGLWLSGHEPSSRFYKNNNCWNFYQSYEKRRRWRRFLSPKKVFKKLSANPAKLTAQHAFEEGLFAHKPTALMISRLVDCWVAHNPGEAAAGRGFDFREQEVIRSGKLKLIKHRTYSYLGPFAQVTAPERWQRKCMNLASMYPEDGANFCAIWQRVS
jgi:SAM-dependent methyltransferase